MASAITPSPQPINCTESGFGRFFFGGDSVIYFSPVIESATDIGRFYQINDPTSDRISDLLATDGGLVDVDGAVGIKYMVKYRRGILVFADNGVWYLSGPDGVFTATSFSLDKITDRGLTAVDSVVLAESAVFYFSREGIIRLMENEFNVIQDEDITVETIRTHYTEFFAGVDSAGGYNPQTKEVWWWQKMPPEGQAPMRTGGTNTARGLVLDLKAQAFYPQHTDDRNNFFAKPVNIERDFFFVKWRRQESDDGMTVTVPFSLRTATGMNFSDGSTPPYVAYMESGDESLGKPVNSKSVVEANFIFNRTETAITDYNWTTGEYDYDNPSGCLLQIKWDYDDTAFGNKWVGATPQSPNPSDNRTIQIYHPNVRGFIPENIPSPINDGNNIIRRRQRLRGSGDSVKFRFESEDNKDMQMLGYTVAYTMKARQ